MSCSFLVAKVFQFGSGVFNYKWMILRCFSLTLMNTNEAFLLDWGDKFNKLSHVDHLHRIRMCSQIMILNGIWKIFCEFCNAGRCVDALLYNYCICSQTYMVAQSEMREIMNDMWVTLNDSFLVMFEAICQWLSWVVQSLHHALLCCKHMIPKKTNLNGWSTD